MPAIHIRVMPALRLRGSLNDMVPLEMASTPVNAVVPLENACKIKNRLNAWASCSISIGGGSITAPRVPVR